MQKSSLLVLALFAIFLNITTGLVGQGAFTLAYAENFADPAFKALWDMYDKPLVDGFAMRSFLWGPTGFASQTERYDQSPGGKRLVQYFDKGRMELTQPESDPSSNWYVSSGLLVRDLAVGIVQVGDNTVQLFEPAHIPVAGDSSAAINKSAPTYADFSKDVAGIGTRSMVGETISTTIKAGGLKGRRDPKTGPVVQYGYYVQETGHNIAEPFWKYFQKRGPLYDRDGKPVEKLIFEWQFLMGYPVSEPYWTTVKINGKDTDTLVQLFERRVLTFTPSNSADFMVEMGNVGRHYYDWRYIAPTPVIQENFVPASINGSATPKVGTPKTTFRINAAGFQPDEALDISLVYPTGKTLTAKKALYANPAGNVLISISGTLLSNGSKESSGVYSITFKGTLSQNLSKIYLRILIPDPLTPAQPYKVDRTVPDSTNAVPVPAVGNGGTRFSALVKGFYIKDFSSRLVSTWLTSPDGIVVPISSSFLNFVNESLEGAIIFVGSLDQPGVWGITIQDKSNPGKKSIIYFRVTEEPPEFALGASLSVLVVRSVSDLLNKAFPEINDEILQPIEQEAGN